MASQDPSARGWRAHPPMQTRYARDWRTHGTQDSRLSRKLKLRILAASLFVVASVIVSLLFVPSKTPTVHILPIGIGRFNDLPINPGGLQDVHAFKQLQEHFGQNFKVESAADSLSGAALKKRLSEVSEHSLTNQHWIVFITLHAMVTGSSDIELYASEAKPDSPDNSSEMVPLIEVFDTLRRSKARRTLLVLDASRLGSHWRMGLLANDIAAELIRKWGPEVSFSETSDSTSSATANKEKKDAPQSHLTVLYAAHPGQRSWTTSEGSLLVKYLISGLSGEADGWTEKSNDAAKDSNITLRELAIYLQKKTAPYQTLLWLGDSEDFQLTTVTAEQQKDESRGDKSAPTKVAASDDKSSSAPGASASKDSDADKEAKSESPSNVNAATSTASDSSKPPTATESGTKPSSTAGQGSPPTESVKERLKELWKWHEGLVRSGSDRSLNRVAQRSPFAFKALEAQLVLAEILRDNGEDAQAQLDKVKDLRLRLPSSEFHLSDLNAKFALQDFFLSEISPDAQTQAEQFAQSLLVVTPPNQPPVDRSKEPTSAVLGQWFLLETHKAKPSDERMKFLQRILERLPPDRVPQTAEMALVLDLWSVGQDQVGDLNPELISRLAKIRSELQSVVKQSPTAVPGIASSLERALRLLDAAEAWFLHLGGDSQEFRDSLKEAETETLRVKQLAETQTKAVMLAGNLFLELASLAEWTAGRSMDDPKRPIKWSNVRELAKNWQDLSRSTKLDRASVSKLLALWPNEPEAYVQLEKSLLSVCAGTQCLKAKLSESAELQRADALDDVARYVDEHRNDLWNQVQRVTQNPAWREAERLRFQTWLSVNERETVMSIFKKGSPTTATVSVSTASLDQLALWQGFWAVLTLSVLDVSNNLELWKDWDNLADLVESEPGNSDRIRKRRIQLGAAVRNKWGAMQKMTIPVQSPFLASLTAARLDATAQPLVTPDEQWKQAEQSGFAEGLRLFAEDWQRRAARAMPSSGVSNHLAKQLQKAAGELGSKIGESTSTASSRFDEFSPVVIGPDRHGLCEVSISDGANRNLQLLVQPSPGIRVEPSDRWQPIPANGKLSLDLRLDSAVQTPQKLSFVLATADRYPLEFRHVSVLSPSDPSQWRIEFLEVASGKPIKEQPFHDPVSGKRGEKIYLPPAGTMQLKAELVRPAADQRVAKLALFRLTADGRERIPLQEAPLKLPPGRERTQLLLNLGGGAEKDPKNPATAPPPQSIDLSRGWVFEITPESEPAFEFHVWPTSWSAETFIETPQPTLTNDRFQVPVTVKAKLESKFLPSQIAAQLQLSEPLKNLLAKEGSVLGSDDPTLTSGQPTELGFQLVKDLGDFGPLDVALDVAGLPHAFRWRILPNGQVKSQDGRPAWLAVKLENGGSRPILVRRKDAKPAVKQETLKLRIQLDATDLDRIDAPEGWELKYQVFQQQETGSKRTPLSDSWRVTSSLDYVVRLESLQDGVWKLSTVTSDYLPSEKKIDGFTGRFQLHTELLHKKVPKAEHTLDFAIDDDTPPTVQIENLPKGEHRTDRSLTFKAVAEDREAGLIRLVYGFDSNKDGKLQSDEEIDPQDLDWFANQNKTWSVTVPKDRLPNFEKKAEMTLIVVATNGLGKESTQSRILTLVKPVVDTSSTGSLIVTFNRKGNTGKALIVLKGPKNDRKIPVGDTHRFDGLPAGEYTIKVEVNYNVLGVLEEGEASATVNAGEVATPDAMDLKPVKPPTGKKK